MVSPSIAKANQSLTEGMPVNSNDSIDSPSTATRGQAILQIERDLVASENSMTDALYYMRRFDSFDNEELLVIRI